ncbi:MAG: cytidine/deoxycytidylate deaminase family protein [Verrucomicrobiales bacterium]|nr:cytidine/deoxycytidylate deaminase family protein [Verrucomicrobiales bacterium]
MQVSDKQDLKFIEAAIRLSAEHMRANDGGPFGAVVVKNGEIIANGWNKVTSSNDPTAHAEVTAIRNACSKLNTFQLNGCVLYTSCEPCPMCLAAAYWARVDRIVFGATRQDAAKIGFDDDFLYHEIACTLDQRKIPTQQLSRDEANKIFAEWDAKADKIRY